MSKIVVWPEAKIASAKRAPGSYGSFRELVNKAEIARQEHEHAVATLQKRMPMMLAVLEHRLKNGEPLTIMRPLRYQTSEIPQIVDEVDDGFYNVRKSERVSDKFVDVIKTILPGTQLLLKSIDPTMQEFIFMDAKGTEHCLNFAERNNLMTQTDVYETVKQYLESKGE